MVIGVVVLAGVLSATIFTLFVVPVAYSLLSRKSGLPDSIGRQLEEQQQDAQQGSHLH